MDASIRSLRALAEALEKLPGVGRKTAERLAYHVLRAPVDEALALADSIREVKESVRHCRQCFHLSEGELCTYCRDESRDRSLLCVVEHPRDLIAIERSGSYRGLYHVLLGSFAPLEGGTVEDLTVESLMKRLRRPEIVEVLLATNADFEGEGTALYLRERMKSLREGLRVTRLARGLPSGSHLEQVARHIVSDAVEGRREMP